MIKKDLRIEWRSPEIAASMLVFSLLAVFMFNFALDLEADLQAALASGIIWITLVFTGTLGLNRSMGKEIDRNCWDGLLLAPVDRAAIFISKAVVNLALMLLVALVLLPVYSFLYNGNLILPGILLVIFLGSVGYSAAGTLLAGLGSQTRLKDSLLPVLLFPVALPLLIAAVKASTGFLQCADWVTIKPWISLITVYDVIMVTIALMLFNYLVEE
jgi:heme exporter protein B